VARLVGDPPMNLLPGRIESHTAGSSTFVCAELRIPLTGTLADAAIALGHDARAVLGVRPNLVALAPAGTSGSTAVELYSDEPFGKYAIATARLGDVLIKAKSARAAPARIGAAVGLVLPTAGFVLFDAASGKAIAFDSLAADDHSSRVLKDR
jgi:ABC-type sugar transport system ATPase subunit